VSSSSPNVTGNMLSVSSASAGYSLVARNVSKSYTKGVYALDNVNLDVLSGEIHALLGQNGSGKSTFVKILAGYHSPDRGSEISICGSQVPLPINPRICSQYGISYVHQDLGLAEGLSVQDNVFVGRYTTGRLWNVSSKVDYAATCSLLDMFGLRVSPSALVGSLSAAERAILAIARAVDQLKGRAAGLIVADEPTAALGREGVKRVFEALSFAAQAGIGVLLVTHRIDEVLEITSRATVLRDGRVVADVVTDDVTESELVELIVGQNSIRRYHSRSPEVVAGLDSGCEVRNLYFRGLSGLSFSVANGEILGITGLQGSGFEDIPNALLSPKGEASGVIRVDDVELVLENSDIRDRIVAGVAVVPADRKTAGASLELSLVENMTIPRISQFFRRGVLRYREEESDARAVASEFMVTPLVGGAALGRFSGGNQQKVVLGKWIKMNPKLLVLAEPTQGVDVGARNDVFSILSSLSMNGACLVVVSNEYQDLALLCDRVLVVKDGDVVQELDREGLSEQALIGACYA